MFYNGPFFVGNAYKVVPVSENEYQCVGMSDKYKILKSDCEPINTVKNHV